ncbi:MAG: class I SAM-dependent methyltransferase [Chloroflexota bacterium]
MSTKQQVSEFYDQVGWQEVGVSDDGERRYQNAHYEDLRPVSAAYIHACHLRIGRHLDPQGYLLLDAGSGPIQYPEYLAYSKGYRYRVCADISIGGLQEARKRIGPHGLFVVCDIANLPFKADAFDGVVSLHTIHHLPQDEHGRAYDELYRVLAPARSAAIVNGWGSAPLANLANGMVKAYRRLRADRSQAEASSPPPAAAQPQGTFVKKHDAAWFQREIASRIPAEILVWRTVNVHFLRTFIHARFGGRLLLRLLYGLEERFPHFLGKHGQYPIIVFRKKRRMMDDR